MIGYRASYAPAEVSFPAEALRDVRVAHWLRDHKVVVDVRTVAELHAAISIGIHPVLMTVHGEQWDLGGLRRASAAGVGRVVLSSPEQIAPMGAGRTQNVLVRITDAAPHHCDDVVDAVIGCGSTTLIGLLYEIGTPTGVTGCPVAIGNMIAQMDHIRRRHNIVLTSLIVGIGDAVPTTGSSLVRRDLAEEIGESVDDACATLRFPRPAIVMAA